MIRLDGALVLLQWSTGGLLFLWVTTRHRLVGLGYGWLLRWTYAVFAAGALAASWFTERVIVRDVASAAVAVAALGAFAVSFRRRKAGVQRQREEVTRKQERVAAMTGVGNVVVAQVSADGDPASAAMQMRDRDTRDRRSADSGEDLVSVTEDDDEIRA